MRVYHEIAPVWNENSAVLILGAIPSPASRAAGFFYMHPQNRFWPVMERLGGARFAYPNGAGKKAVEERRDFLLNRGIALWDVAASCDIIGAADSSIKNVVANDLSPLLRGARVTRVLCAGKKAFALYQKYCAPLYTQPCAALPSTSAANARWSLEDLVREYARQLSFILF